MERREDDGYHEVAAELADGTERRMDWWGPRVVHVSVDGVKWTRVGYRDWDDVDAID